MSFLRGRNIKAVPCVAIALIVWGVFCSRTVAQNAGASPDAASVLHPLITAVVDESRLTTLKGNVHPLARPQFDLGTAPGTLAMDRMLLVLERSPGQEAALRKLLDDQQDRNSPSYHKWMTPEQYGEQFGPSDADMQTITSWLQSHGFQVGTTKGRTVLEFSGSASQVEEAFHSTIHKYLVNGEQHWANANDPQIPSALAPAVAGVLTLHNFIKKPASHLVPQPAAAKLRIGKKPEVSFPQNGGVTNALSPADFRTIYGMNNLTIPGYSVIAVVGRSNLYNGGQDVGNFQSVFGGGNFSIIVNGPDPGDLGGGEEAEATLDSSWSMGLAPVATVNLVVSSTTDTTDGIDLSEVYIIEHNLAPIMTESFSGCELFATDTQLAGQSALAEQAAAQGITYIVSTGDSGAAGCDDPNFPPAIYPISVNFLASTAFNVAVGGTMFNENGNPSKYWASSPPISETALSYIPENVWNESSSTGLWAGSGGASAGNIASGLGTTSGVPKPNWQYGVPGIPADSVRDLPDVSLSAAGHDPYLLCLEGSCVPDSTGSIYVYFISGTSASAPSFAAIMAYLDDLNARITGYGRMGLANYILYRLGATLATYPSKCNGSNTAAAPESDCVFYDVTTGNNVVPGETGALYQAGVGYDLTTGLGSVNVLNLLAEWESVHFNPTTTGITFGASTVTHGSPVPFTITVMPSSGTGVPTGDTFLEVQGSFGFTPEPTGIGPFPLSGGTVSSTTTALPGGTYNVVADYAGDTTYAPSASALSSALNVTPEASTTTVSVLTADQNGQPIPFTSGPFGSFVYLRADVAGQSGQGFATGSVTFTDSFGTIPGGSTFALNGQGNTANPNGVFSFDTGTHTISASYGGDGSFNASSSGQPQTFTIAPGFFAAVGQSTVVVTAPGGTGQTSISISNSTGFSGTISLACSGLPSEAKCLFSPTSVTVNGTAGTTMASIAVTTAAATAGLRPNLRLYLPAQLVSMGLFAFVLLACPKRQRVRGLVLLSMMTLLLLVPACGGSGGGGSKNPPPNLGTPAGTSNVTVTATSGSTVSSTGFTLVIQ